MKPLNLLLLSSAAILVIGCSELPVDFSKTVEKDGIRYIIQPDGSSNEPFTGVLIEKYDVHTCKAKIVA